MEKTHLVLKVEIGELVSKNSIRLPGSFMIGLVLPSHQTFPIPICFIPMHLGDFLGSRIHSNKSFSNDMSLLQLENMEHRMYPG